jgi:hypothetical protein
MIQDPDHRLREVIQINPIQINPKRYCFKIFLKVKTITF